jgi:glucose/arabinose dehydrogenase
MLRARLTTIAIVALIVLQRAGSQGLLAASTDSPLVGQAAYGDWKSDTPGVRRYIREFDLPASYASNSATNRPVLVKKPAGAQLSAPVGFQVKLFASGLDRPRLLRVAPNGDIFVAESRAGRIRVLRPSNAGDEVSRNEIFASGLNLPFGIAFYPRGNDPQWVYVANTDSVVRFRYQNGELHANQKAEVIVGMLPHGGIHWTRDIAISLDDARMIISVGSASNDAESMAKFDARSRQQWMPLLRQGVKGVLFGRAAIDEVERADVLAFNAQGEGRRIYVAFAIASAWR